MQYLIIRSISIFITVLEIFLFLHMFAGFFKAPLFKNKLAIFVDPVLNPIRFLLRHSIFQTPVSDISPIIAFVILTYIGQLLSYI